ncbi:MAG: branched-chain amino acid ABC transporter permease [Streptosporangiaceae bacterium]
MQIVLSGLATGAIYGLVAMAFAIAFYVTRVINFAQGQLLMVAVMVTAALSRAGWPTGVAVAAGLAAAVVFGALIYLLAVRPVLAFDRFSFAWLVSTLGVATILEAGAALVWGPTSRGFPTMLNGQPVHLLGAVISLQQVLAIVAGVVAVAAFELFRRRTLFGKLGMAIAADPEMASAIGANTQVVAVVAFALAGLLAGVAGVLVGPITFANPYIGSTFGINGFVALMIGGIERPAGALVGGLLLGVLSQLANTEINSQASDWFPFVIVLVVLLLRPSGLFSAARWPRLRLARSS